MTLHAVIPAAQAAQLLGEYRAGSSFFLSSPRQTLLAEGVYAALPAEGGPGALKRLPQRVAALLAEAAKAGYPGPLVVGAVPFDPASPAQLVVPAAIRRVGPLTVEAADLAPQPSESGDYSIRAMPAPKEYVRGVERGLELLRAGELSKIVLARTLRLDSPTAVDVGRLLRNLVRHNTHGYTFAVDLPEWQADGADPDGFGGEGKGREAIGGPAGRRTLLGASPELLVSRSGRKVTANPLAGSTPRSADPAEDRRRAEALLASAKDSHEHAVVVEAVAAALRPYCRTLDVPARPSLVHTATMWHLSTEIVGELTDESVSSLELAAALHPTPAVCGAPTEAAREAIGEIEPFDRGFYTGMVGWCDAAGDGEWIVTIRCAEVGDRSLRLFAGAGVVAESNAEAELAETSAKFRTMLRALGINDE